MQHSPETAITKIIQNCHCRNYNNCNMYDNIETFYGAIAKIVKTANTTTVTANEVSTYIVEASVNFNIELTSRAVKRNLENTQMKLDWKQSKQYCFPIFERS